MSAATLADPATLALALGRPQFADQALQAIQARDGDLAAWQAAFTQADPATVLARMGGDFAVALTLPDGRQLLAVDRFAIRTLCYRVEAAGERSMLRVAEQADALAAPGDGVNRQAVFDYLYFHAIPSPGTAHAGVMRLPPAHCLVFDGRHATVTPYWVPTFQDKGPPQRTNFGASFEQLRDEFRRLLRDAVAATADPARPASFLSGGTDSSTVAGMLREATGQKPATFSIGFDAEGYDEMAFARIAAQRFDTEHHEYYVTPDDLVRSMPEVAAGYDQPFGNSSALPAYFCALMAKREGVRRILAGDGGDELFGGNLRYAKQRVFNVYDHVPGALRSALLEPVLGTRAARQLPLLRKAASYVEQAREPLPQRLETYNLLLRLGLADVLTPAFRAQVDEQGPIKAQQAVWQQARTGSLLNRQLAFDWRYTLAETDLPKVCGTTRLAGLDVAFPMLDARLVDFSLRLPADAKLKGLKLRWFFKEALRGFLPDEIITKKKQGFGLPFGVWTQRHAGLKAMAGDALGSLSTRNLVRPPFLDALLNQRLPEHPGYYGEMVWILTMLELWLRAHAPQWRIE